jgi:ABC-type glycerol-3-phosphate transport system permease component
MALGKRAHLNQVIIGAVMTVVSAIMFFPFLWMVLNSFKKRAEINRGNTFLPAEWIMDNYATVFDTVPFWSWFRNSVTVTLIGVLITLFTGTLIGFIFAKYNFKFKGACFWFVLATMMVPSQVTMIPSFLLVSKIGLYDSLAALFVPGMVGGFSIFLCKQFIEDVPDSLCEAALIDGAKDFYIYFSIILPLIRPAIGALSIFTFLQYWNDYLSPLLYIALPENMTMALAISFFSTARATDRGAVMACATLIMLPMLILFLAFQKQFIKGIAITGIK